MLRLPFRARTGKRLPVVGASPRSYPRLPGEPRESSEQGVDAGALTHDGADPAGHLDVRGMLLVAVEGRLILVLGDEDHVPVAVRPARVGTDGERAQARDDADEGLEALPDLFRLAAALVRVGGGQLPKDDVADHGDSFRGGCPEA